MSKKNATDILRTLRHSLGFGHGSSKGKEKTEAPVDNPLALILPECVEVALRSDTKDGVIREMVDVLERSGKIADKARVLEDVLQREATMSTGMQHGIALPHGKSDGVREICAAIGIKKEGIAFDSIDGEASRIFVTVVSPQKAVGPHIQFMAAISSLLKDEGTRERMLAARSRDELYACLNTTGPEA